jgi:NAD(P)-dependent dehydrogenase (short-subunit alcohol dehydrogenase family)
MQVSPERTVVVITGSTRGLGFCMAREFLARGCAVVISGRTNESVKSAVALAEKGSPGVPVLGFACDVREPSQVQALWEAAEKQFTKVDHWINNAGIGQPMQPIWSLTPEMVEDVFRTNVLGTLFGARAAMQGMTPHGSGAIWVMEGHGSDGRVRSGLSVYGASKRALRYVASALAKEAKGTGILIGVLSPGLMITDFTMKQLDKENRAEWERTKKVFNIIADKPETVAAFLAPRILAARGRSIRISWLKDWKVFWRFATAGLAKRKVIED